MAMAANDIERLIRARIPDAEVTIRDLAGDGDHYAATVIAASFRGKSRVQQHQIVYDALKAEMGGKLHALALQTGIPEALSASGRGRRSPRLPLDGRAVLPNGRRRRPFFRVKYLSSGARRPGLGFAAVLRYIYCRTQDRIRRGTDFRGGNEGNRDV